MGHLVIPAEDAGLDVTPLGGAFLALDLTFGQAALAAVASWTCLLSLANLAYAQMVRRRIIVDVTDDGHFAIYERRPKDAALLGRTSALKVRLDEPDPSRLGTARFSDEHREVEVGKLSASDLQALGRFLP